MITYYVLETENGDVERMFFTYQDMVKFLRKDHVKVYCFSDRGVLLCAYCVAHHDESFTLEACAL